MTSAVSALSRAELEARLEEAEETLRAIRDGEIDAVVVRGADEEQVFTLEGGGQSYRTFMEAMDVGAAAFDQDGQLLYANQALCALLDCAHGSLTASALIGLLDQVNQAAFRRLLAQAQRERQSAEIHLRVGSAERSMLLTGTPLEFGVVRGAAITFTDISEREQAAAARESERLARAILSSANEAVIVCDRAGRVTHLNGAAMRICAEAPVGKTFAEAIALSFPEASELMSSDDIVVMATAGLPVQGLEAAVRTPSAAITDVMISAAPLVVSGERTQGCVVTLVDLSQRKAAERHQALLMGELDHRVKNTLTMVMAICARTAAHERTIEDFQKSFTGRIQALAATHTLLSNASWQNLQIRDVLAAELAPFASLSGGRIVTDGLDIAVDAKTAVSLGLVFHELTTNAVKYGALSVPSGRISVRRVGVTDEALTIEWQEHDGPPVTPPQSSGFGQTLISRSLGNGGAKLEFPPAGVVCQISIPRS
ncbi:PAS domain-containing protein [Rhodopseudomonas palustris]|uniref:PAS domain-containing sensor histidine kinase n=1 Tax=Rhodopseudomonas palustris TaxID=1076 RepID=UPI0021F3B124|nr:HWE histidine kinase domain-containing protein [Rhodopseudomonas palustris]UYO44462.1 PAS domain-containing protein [Rhodopseudomonas palustris]